MASVKNVVLEGLVKKMNKAKKGEWEIKQGQNLAGSDKNPDKEVYKKVHRTDKKGEFRNVFHKMDRGHKKKTIERKSGKYQMLALKRKAFTEAIIRAFEAVDIAKRKERLDKIRKSSKPDSKGSFYKNASSGKQSRSQAIVHKHTDPNLRKTNPEAHKKNADFSKFVRSKYKPKAKKAFESCIIEGLVKKMNKAKKNAWEIKQGEKAPDADFKVNPGRSDKQKKAFHRTQRNGNFLDSADRTGIHGYKRGKKTRGQFTEAIINSFSKLVETDTAVEDDTDLKYDREEHARIRATKGVSKTPQTRGANRKAAMGLMGGLYDKKGNKAQVKHNTKSPWAQDKGGTKEKPLPLKASLNKDPRKVLASRAKMRGKSVMTSRSTGLEKWKANKNSTAFNNFLIKLSKNKN